MCLGCVPALATKNKGHHYLSASSCDYKCSGDQKGTSTRHRILRNMNSQSKNLYGLLFLQLILNLNIKVYYQFPLRVRDNTVKQCIIVGETQLVTYILINSNCETIPFPFISSDPVMTLLLDDNVHWSSTSPVSSLYSSMLGHKWPVF